jgi:hypothetical protein
MRLDAAKPFFAYRSFGNVIQEALEYPTRKKQIGERADWKWHVNKRV